MQLKEYPVEACKLHLSVLDLSNNSLTGLPPEIGKLKEYPVEACKLHLSVLDLSNNSLTGLPPEIGNMTTLRKLLLTGNPLRTLRSSLVSGPTAALLKYLRSRLSEGEDSEITTPTKEDVITRAARLSIASKELSLEGLSLSAVPSEVWESGEVIKVDLSRNAIQELPFELSSCISLQLEAGISSDGSAVALTEVVCFSDGFNSDGLAVPQMVAGNSFVCFGVASME
ncbi:plant intracellular ras-group-related lrr protein 6, partial [Quercus suber]